MFWTVNQQMQVAQRSRWKDCIRTVRTGPDRTDGRTCDYGPYSPSKFRTTIRLSRDSIGRRHDNDIILPWRRPIESWFNVIVVLNFVGEYGPRTRVSSVQHAYPLLVMCRLSPVCLIRGHWVHSVQTSNINRKLGRKGIAMRVCLIVADSHVIYIRHTAFVSFALCLSRFIKCAIYELQTWYAYPKFVTDAALVSTHCLLISAPSDVLYEVALIQFTTRACHGQAPDSTDCPLLLVAGLPHGTAASMTTPEHMTKSSYYQVQDTCSRLNLRTAVNASIIRASKVKKMHQVLGTADNEV